MTRSSKDWFYLLALVAIWGSAFMFTRIALASFPPATLVALRLCLGAITLIASLAFIKNKSQSINRKLLGFFIVMAIVGNSAPFFLISWGQQYVSSGLAGIMMAIMPLATLFMAHFFLPNEPLTRRRLVGFTLGFIGIVVLIGPNALLEIKTAGITSLAQLAILGGALCYAAGTIIARLRPESNDLLTAMAVLIIASLLMLPVSLITETPWIKPVSIQTGLALLFLGVVATAIATFIYFRLLRSAGATFISQINYLIPLWALAAGALFLDEKITWNSVVALVLILGGIAVAQAQFSMKD
ncbi:TPA: DMT family transporter [Candidatus Bathyarchaeota archaeon]|nr:DMT family transporter [Candidatus Bathyarchaeota archaeon]HIP67856.1 DMT family transporter [Chromatiales bacterium]